jgi:hypothetical protein
MLIVCCFVDDDFDELTGSFVPTTSGDTAGLHFLNDETTSSSHINERLLLTICCCPCSSIQRVTVDSLPALSRIVCTH